MILAVKLVKQVAHQTVSMWFIIQSFLSVVFLYGGIYTLMYCISPYFLLIFSYKFDNESFDGIFSVKDQEENNVFAYIQFLTFSTGLMTNGTPSECMQ